MDDFQAVPTATTTSDLPREGVQTNQQKDPLRNEITSGDIIAQLKAIKEQFDQRFAQQFAQFAAIIAAIEKPTTQATQRRAADEANKQRRAQEEKQHFEKPVSECDNKLLVEELDERAHKFEHDDKHEFVTATTDIPAIKSRCEAIHDTSVLSISDPAAAEKSSKTAPTEEIVKTESLLTCESVFLTIELSSSDSSVFCCYDKFDFFTAGLADLALVFASKHDSADAIQSRLQGATPEELLDAELFAVISSSKVWDPGGSRRSSCCPGAEAIDTDTDKSDTAHSKLCFAHSHYATALSHAATRQCVTRDGERGEKGSSVDSS